LRRLDRAAQGADRQQARRFRVRAHRRLSAHARKPMSKAVRQHLIDPEICIRCYTCEDACPIDAITHDDNNVVVDPAKCDLTMDCIAPCPTGAIDNWRVVTSVYSLEDQFGWDELPEQEEIETEGDAFGEAIEDDIGALIAAAHAGTGGRPVAPASAASPSINLFSRSHPAVATVQGSYRITDPESESDVRHIILGFGEMSFPVLEGQSVGIVPPGTREDGRPHDIRL